MSEKKRASRTEAHEHRLPHRPPGSPPIGTPHCACGAFYHWPEGWVEVAPTREASVSEPSP